MLKKYKKIIFVFVALFLIQFFANGVNANRDGAYCVGTQGYVYAVATDYSCTSRGLPGDPNCPYTGRHYPGSPKACTAGERTCIHHFCRTCPTCTPPPPPCSERWNEWTGCSTTACDGGTRTRTSRCGTWPPQTQECSVDGSCGVNYNDTESVQETETILNESSLGLCATGSVENFAGSGTDEDPYTWTCAGTGTCEDATCDAVLVKGTIGASCIDGGYEFIYTGLSLNWPVDFEFCAPSTANPVSNPDPVPVPNLNTTNNGFSSTNPGRGTQSWTCSTANGTDGSTCTAFIDPPSVECGTDSNEDEVNIKPSGNNLCGDVNNNNVVPEVSLGADGRWVWGCQHSFFTGITANPSCSTPSCIANGPVTATSPVMISDNMTSTVSVSCSGLDPNLNLCCTITNNKNEIPITVCSGYTDQIQIEPGQNELSSICWFEDNYDDPPTCDPSTETCVNVSPITVQTMCISRSCNAQNTCQATPILGDSLDDCSSTCNSNADCSSGRIIETRP